MSEITLTEKEFGEIAVALYFAKSAVYEVAYHRSEKSKRKIAEARSATTVDAEVIEYERMRRIVNEQHRRFNKAMCILREKGFGVL